jgi:hypothetical protein
MLIQLLNLVQSQRLNHTFFFGLPFKNYFFHLWTSLVHPTTGFKKNSHLPYFSTYVTDFFFKALFIFAIIITTATVPSPAAIVDV